jgi:phosphate starvation-inducible PhoH-like protein
MQPIRDWQKEQEQAVLKKVEENELRDIEALVNKCKIKPKTTNQDKYLKYIDKYIITLCAGPAGTGKTFLAMAKAMEHLLSGKVKKIILTRPLLECDEELGFLPGGLDEKTLPYMLPLFDSVEKLVGKKVLEKLINKEEIIVSPLAYMRGRSFDDSFIILDEAQNATYKQLKMFLTRFGEHSKIVVCGDVSQSDVNVKINPFAEVSNRLKGNEFISRVLFKREDIVRHPLIQWIDEKLS